MNKYWCFLLLLVFVNLHVGAMDLLRDTFRLKELTVSAPREKLLSDAGKVLSFDSSTLAENSGRTLGELLAQHSAVNIRSYGSSGSSSGIGLRGMGAAHTQVLWNGFPLNSLTMGETDLSGLPAIGFDKVSVIYCASGSVFGSGTFGGALTLDNQAVFDQKLHGYGWLESGSMQTITNGFKVSGSTKNIYVGTNVWSDQSEGNFSYYDYVDGKSRQRANNSHQLFGTLTNVAVKISDKTQLDAGVWYQFKMLHLPGIMGQSSNITETQRDSTLKGFLTVKQRFNQSVLQVKGAAFYDYMRYTKKLSPNDTQYSIFSEIESVKTFFSANYRYYIHKNIVTDLGYDQTWLNAKVKSYNGQKSENVRAFLAGSKYTSRFGGLNLSVRNETNNGSNSGLLWSAGGSANIVSQILIVRANWSQKYKFPTFNDKYWIPGGNPELKNEIGSTYEFGLAGLTSSTHHWKIRYDLAYYHTDATNLIAWKPVNGSIWAPVNYSTVRINGVDATINAEKHFGNTVLGILENATWNVSDRIHSNDGKSLTRLPYTPDLVANTKIFVENKIGKLALIQRFVSSRYDVDNKLMPFFNTLNLEISVPIKLTKAVHSGLQIQVLNMTDTRYELYRSYPMPGRLYRIKLFLSI